MVLQGNHEVRMTALFPLPVSATSPIWWDATIVIRPQACPRRKRSPRYHNCQTGPKYEPLEPISRTGQLLPFLISAGRFDQFGRCLEEIQEGAPEGPIARMHKSRRPSGFLVQRGITPEQT